MSSPVVNSAEGGLLSSYFEEDSTSYQSGPTAEEISWVTAPPAEVEGLQLLEMQVPPRKSVVAVKSFPQTGEQVDEYEEEENSLQQDNQDAALPTK